MKYLSTFSLLLLILLLLPLQESLTQELPYDEGTVWEITFVRTKPGMTNDYLQNLAANWKMNAEEGKKQGLILSYKILSGLASNKDDWNLMLMLEYKNMSALDGAENKWEVINNNHYVSIEERKVGITKRSEIREILGDKIVREIILK